MITDAPRYDWIFRYRLHHLLFWALYHFTWWTVYEGSASRAFSNLFYPHVATKFLFYVVFQATGVYFCLYYLIPRLLEKGKYVSFFAWLLLTVLVTAVLIASGYFLGAYFANQDVYTLFKVPSRSPLSLFKSQTLPSTVGAMTMGMSIKLAKNYLKAQEQRRVIELAAKEQQRILEKEKLETELKFLRSQFNPHFLFNTINSIFVLINKNTALASHSLAKFSELLRYQLYECNEPQIPLATEINYLKSFVELETLRLDEHCEISVVVPDPPVGDLMIAPFILMPFIENAFKHVSQDNSGGNWIRIRLRLHEKVLHFNLENSADTRSSHTSEAVACRGLGLENVRRRLTLLYKDQHHLEVQNEAVQFAVSLRLTLGQPATEPMYHPIAAVR